MLPWYKIICFSLRQRKHLPACGVYDGAVSRLKTGSIIGCNTFRTIDSVSGDKGLWVPGDCLTTQTNIATAYIPQSSDSDKPIGSVMWSMLRTVME